MPKSRNARERRASAEKEVDKSPTWPPEMDGDVLALVLDELAYFNTSRPFPVFDQKHYEGAPYLTPNARYALKSCSTVCRTWRLPAQRRLLHSVRLNNSSEADNMAGALKSGDLAIIPRHATLRLPMSPSPAVNALASMAHLQSLVMRSGQTGEDGYADLAPICILMLGQCTFFANISSFHFHVFNTIPLEIFGRFLVVMPILKDLHLNVPSIRSGDSEDTDIPAPTFLLRYLELWDEGFGDFQQYDWLLRSSRGSLKTLAIYFILLPRECRTFLSSFRMIAPSLRTLRVPYLDDQPLIIAMISQCTSLIELALSVTCFRKFAPSIVASLPPTLHCLRVGDDFESYLGGSNPRTRFSVVRKAIARSPLPTRLTTIVIDLREWELLVNVKSQVKAVARACIPKGITVWIACPAEEHNLTEEIERQSAPGWSKTQPDSDSEAIWEGLGVDFDSEDEAAYESDFTTLSDEDGSSPSDEDFSDEMNDNYEPDYDLHEYGAYP